MKFLNTTTQNEKEKRNRRWMWGTFIRIFNQFNKLNTVDNNVETKFLNTLFDKYQEKVYESTKNLTDLEWEKFEELSLFRKEMMNKFRNRLNNNNMAIINTENCDECNGEGKVNGKKCRACNGTGLQPKLVDI